MIGDVYRCGFYLPFYIHSKFYFLLGTCIHDSRLIPVGICICVVCQHRLSGVNVECVL